MRITAIMPVTVPEATVTVTDTLALRLRRRVGACHVGTKKPAKAHRLFVQPEWRINQLELERTNFKLH